jgi:hypothetical protein
VLSIGEGLDEAAAGELSQLAWDTGLAALQALAIDEDW